LSTIVDIYIPLDMEILSIPAYARKIGKDRSMVHRHVRDRKMKHLRGISEIQESTGPNGRKVYHLIYNPEHENNSNPE